MWILFSKTISSDLWIIRLMKTDLNALFFQANCTCFGSCAKKTSTLCTVTTCILICWPNLISCFREIATPLTTFEHSFNIWAITCKINLSIIIPYMHEWHAFIFHKHLWCLVNQDRNELGIPMNKSRERSVTSFSVYMWHIVNNVHTTHVVRR